MNILHLPLAVITASALVVSSVQAEEATATTEPVGFVTVNISPGSGVGVGKRTTLFSIPLQETESIEGQAAGFITGITSNTISNQNAGWSPGALSTPSSPFLIQITSGNAAGRMFLIASSAATGGALAGTPSTDTTVTVSTVDTTQVDLTTLGISVGNDTYKIFAADTLSSFFGTPETTGVLGGANPNSADSIVIVLNGTASTYWYNTSTAPHRWSRQGPGAPDSANVVLIPNLGIQYSRLPDTALSFVVTGQVPTIQRQVSVKNSGTTLLSQFWPVDSTVAGLGLETIPGWVSGANVASADTFIATSGGVATTYFFDGTNWRRQGPGSPLSDENPITVGTSIKIVKKGSTEGFATLAQSVPYELD